MATLLVSYDLKAPGRNYGALYEALKSTGTWWHHLESTWLIVASTTAVALRDSLTRHLDSNDKLLVIDVSGDPAAWRGIPTNGSDWLKSNV